MWYLWENSKDSLYKHKDQAEKQDDRLFSPLLSPLERKTPHARGYWCLACSCVACTYWSMLFFCCGSLMQYASSRQGFSNSDKEWDQDRVTPHGNAEAREDGGTSSSPAGSCLANLVMLIATKLLVKTKVQDINYFIPCNESYICSVIPKLKW